MSNNYLMPYEWHRLFCYCKSTFFCGMHFCLQYDNYSAYYASIMLDAFRHLLCSKLCQHNRLVPTQIPLANHAKSLGVIIDKHLNWTDHVNMITATANSVRGFLNVNVLAMLNAPPILRIIEKSSETREVANTCR